MIYFRLKHTIKESALLNRCEQQVRAVNWIFFFLQSIMKDLGLISYIYVK